MSASPADPRLLLTVDDLITLCAAIEIALPSINKVDGARYQELAVKLATILVGVQQYEDSQYVDLPA